MGIINLLKKQHYAFIKIDPPIICSERDNKGNIIYFSNTINDILKNLKGITLVFMMLIKMKSKPSLRIAKSILHLRNKGNNS